MDARYRDGERVVSVIACLESTLYPVLCVLLYRAICTRHASRHALEVIVCVCQVYGAVMFLGCEAWDGNQNIVPPSLQWQGVAYFWFGYLANYFWLVLPTYLGYQAFQKAQAGGSAAKS